MIAVGLFVAYVLMIGMLLGRERIHMLSIVDQLEVVHRHEELLTRVNGTVAQSVMLANEFYFETERQPDWQLLILSVEAVQAGLYALSRFVDNAPIDGARLQPYLTSLAGERSRSQLLDLRSMLRELARHLDEETVGLRIHKAALHESYRLNFDALSLVAVVFGLLGFTVFGSVVAMFFSRVAWDVKRLQRRAIEIVNGYRGPMLPVVRGDEIGALMNSVNRMQSELRDREVSLAMSREEKLHKEKMATVGSFASAIAHEINNPIAAITGVAEEIAQTSQGASCPRHGSVCRPQLILEHARRISLITRQIADFTAPGSPDPQLLDLNSLVERTCAFITYDRRFHGARLTLELDRQLPATEAISDHLTQVLMNLLVNAADAFEDIEGRQPLITIRTSLRGGRIEVAVIDNGQGMPDEVLAHAFDEYFTTKAPGRGTGIGLSLSRRLMLAMGGDIELRSRPGEGCTAIVSLPVPPEFASQLED